MKNTHKVPGKMWRKLSDHARHVFNTTFQQMKNQEVYTHPSTYKMNRDEWKTIRWNAALTSAFAVDGYELSALKK